MLISRYKLLLAACLAMLWLTSTVAWGCSVPVFRYALERWPADAYQVVVFHREPLTANQKNLIGAWQEAGEKGVANLSVEVVDVSAGMSASHQKLWNAQTNVSLPWVVALYPSDKEIETPVWAGPLDAEAKRLSGTLRPTSEAIKTLLTSPARGEIARRLCKGDSVVWLLLESGDPKRDQTVATLFEDESRKLEQSLKLPDADAEGPQVRSEIPLKIAFSILRVSRNTPAEQIFRDMLLHLDSELAAVTEPIVFAVFGRGRALPMPVGKDLQPEVIREAAEFLTSACSCEVKSLNPGVDLLIAADWEGMLEGRVVKDPELPPLVGMGQFGSVATNRDPDLFALTNVAAASGNGGGPFSRNMALLAIGVFAAVGLGTILLTLKRRP